MTTPYVEYRRRIVLLLVLALAACGGANLPDVELAPAPPPAPWMGIIGEYAWRDTTLFLLERDGHLRAFIPGVIDTTLVDTPDPDVFQVPGSDDLLQVRREGAGPAASVEWRGVVATRRLRDLGASGQLHVTPVRPVAELLTEARAARPLVDSGATRKPDLVSLTALDSTIHLDIRYATTNNFLGTPFYDTAAAWLQRPAAEALVRVSHTLARQGYGLLIHDGYRPWYVTRTFWDATPDSLRWLVADPAHGSRHNRGAAVDLTLYDLNTGEPVRMPGTYDETTYRSQANYPGGTSRQRWLRALLRRSMEAEGFHGIRSEWWHFDYGDWEKYPILNVPFGELAHRQR